MLFGPLPIVFAEKLRQLLQAQGADGKIYHSAHDVQEIERARNAVLNRAPQPYPMFENARDLVHIEIEPKHLLIVRGELEKMGFSVPARTHTPIPGEDYLCPVCDFHGDAPGPCPRDGTALLLFSEWAERKRLRNSRRDRIIAWLILTVMASAGLVRVYTFFKDQSAH
jgi:hypothetical protein